MIALLGAMFAVLGSLIAAVAAVIVVLASMVAVVGAGIVPVAPMMVVDTFVVPDERCWHVMQGEKRKIGSLP